MVDPLQVPEHSDIRSAREQFPATENSSYFNTATLGLASRRLTATLHAALDDWAAHGFDYDTAERAGERARSRVARMIGTDAANIAQISSVSGMAGFVATQLPPARPGDNIVIGEREFSSNHFPWRMLAERGYEVRQVPFRHGGLEPDDVGSLVDGSTRLVAFSAVQTASGHRSDTAAIAALAHEVGAIVFVDGTQAVGSLSVQAELGFADVMAIPAHKYLLNAGRGVGYCYISPTMQDRFHPVSPGWKAGREPYGSFFGPTMDLSPTASRFDTSVSWMGTLGDDAALQVFDEFGEEEIYARNRELADTLVWSLGDIGWAPLDLPEANRSSIVAVPLGERDARSLVGGLHESGIACTARDGNLRLAVHFYNHEDDVDRLVGALRAAA